MIYNLYISDMKWLRSISRRCHYLFLKAHLIVVRQTHLKNT